MKLLVKFRNTIMLFLKLLVVMTVTTAFIGTWQNFYREALFSSKGNYLVVFSYVAIFMVFSEVYDGFKIGIMRMHELTYSLSLSAFLTNFFTYLEMCLIARKLLNPLAIFVLFVSQILMIAVFSYALSHVYFTLYKARRMLAIFSPGQHNDVVKKMSIIKERFFLQKGLTIEHGFEEITRTIDDYEAVLICDFEPSLKSRILKYCYANNKRIYLLPSSTDTILNGTRQVQVFDTPVLFLHNGGLSLEQRMVKRVFDVVLSLLGIIVASPIMLIIALLIKLDDHGPIIFRQERVTRNGRLFNIYKFRSMKLQTDAEVKKTTVNDDRITAVGKLIRPLRFDELPQLFNILFGDMSIVGPRPEMKELVDDYSKQLPEFELRHKVKAGLTGYAQIYGKYNTTPQNKLNMDLHYIEHYSFLEDIKLIAMTVKILFVRESTEGFKESDSRLSQTERK